MSEDNNVGKVNKSLQKKRFGAKYKHTKNFSKFEAEMWNSGDYQFIALWRERVNIQNFDAPNLKERRYSYDGIRLTFFGYNYVFWTHEKEKHLTKEVNPIHIRPKITQELRDFLVQKPENETFVIPDFRGSYHLSFEKRSLFGPKELKWRFLHNEQEWSDARSLPRQEKKRALKNLKHDETRKRLWFVDEQSNKLIAHLDSVLPQYSTLPPDAFIR